MGGGSFAHSLEGIIEGPARPGRTFDGAKNSSAASSNKPGFPLKSNYDLFHPDFPKPHAPENTASSPATRANRGSPRSPDIDPGGICFSSESFKA